MLFLYFVLFAVGIYLLIKSSDFLVDGASSLASRLQISPLVIGLTIVAFGTSAPEFVVSVASAISGSSDLALGNVIGSNIFNILFILGLCAMIFPIQVKKNTIWKEIPLSLLGAIITFVLASRVLINSLQYMDFNQIFNRFPEVNMIIGVAEGLILILIFVVFMYYIFGISKSEQAITEVKKMTVSKASLFVFLGILGLSLSAKYLVTDSAIGIAKIFNISENLIGLTLVSIGTGLPELATSVKASIKGKSEIAIGNVVGSNIFNITLILGASLIFKPIQISLENIVDLSMLIFSTVLLFILTFIFKKYRISKIEAMTMLSIYAIYMGYLFNR